MGLDPWLILLRYSQFEEFHFWLANFLQGRPKKFKIFIGWVKHFSENPLSMCRITWHSTFWAILCLSSHSCTIVSYYSLQLKILWSLTFKNLVFLHWFKLFIHGFIAWFYSIFMLFLSYLQFNHLEHQHCGQISSEMKMEAAWGARVRTSGAWALI